MVRVLTAFAVAAAVMIVAPDAEAHRDKSHVHYKKHRIGKVHYGGKPGLGYWRKGPEQGKGFRFSTYKSDPFGSDDYYDGNRCFYVRHSDHCVKNNIFSGFNWPYLRRY